MDRSIEEITAYLNSNDPQEQMSGLLSVGRMRLHLLLGNVLCTLENRDCEVRAAAAWTLDLLGNPEAVPALVQALYDESFTVRSNAGWALVHLGNHMIPQLVVPDVIDVLRDKAHPSARQMAYLVLSRIGGSDATDAIQTYWRSS